PHPPGRARSWTPSPISVCATSTCRCLPNASGERSATRMTQGKDLRPSSFWASPVALRSFEFPVSVADIEKEMRLPNIPRNALLPAIVTVVVVAGASFASTHHSGVVEAVRAARDAAHDQNSGTHLDGS